MGTDGSISGPIVLSDSPNSAVMKVRGRKPRKCNRDINLNLSANLDLSADLANLEFSSCPNRLACEDVVDKDVDDLAGMASGWLNNMELVRTKSKKLNDRLSGCSKNRIACMRSMIRILVKRVKDSGDISYLRRRNDELTAQLRESRREEIRLQGFLKEADAKVEKLSNEIFELRRRIGSMSVESERLPSLSIKSKQGTPRVDTPKKKNVKEDRVWLRP